MSTDDYKSAKEAFVSNTSGSSIWHINLVSCNALASIALYSALRQRLSWSLPFIFEYNILVTPLILSITIFALKPLILLVILCLLIGLTLIVPPRPAPPPLTPIMSPTKRTLSLDHPETLDKLATPGSSDSEDEVPRPPIVGLQPVAAVSTYRAHMMLLTILSILAVDFPIFPRELAKCETFGVSMMDLGVGSFVFSQGLVSAIPMVKDVEYLRRPMLSKLSTTIIKLLPIVVLGLLRVILVKGTDYPEHASEYGTHWNFFLTLAILPALQVLVHPFILTTPIATIALLITCFHQLLLSYTSLQSWTLDSPRISLLSHNKEGVVSLPGYLSIQLLGLLTGTLVLPATPSTFRRALRSRNPTAIGLSPSPRAMATDRAQAQLNSMRRFGGGARRQFLIPKRELRKDDKIAIELSSYAAIWWTLYGIAYVYEVGGGVSRRLANLQYGLWTASFNTTFLLGYIVLDIQFYPIKSFVAGLRFSEANLAPVLLEAINKNGLILFLLANVATGLINLSVQTMYTSNSKAFLILILYSFVIAIVAWYTRHRRLVKL
ncbi:hypothetical protein SISNIDRAFT_477615 [Sistotremastrum niveocremeum HHB9708]|uniref:GPI-anchored wall transfer protein n=1 Tax=Sistotremastrum niveocremeum HHB9708 TaxID=1314777 RepID=A0A164YJW8_9AGAM|nr:hypothetical protein SISNIDRAFT_477615 [Sistotremastrum niveocremeum HHB9708]